MKIKRNRVTVDFTGEQSRTKQAFKEECDINNIVKKYQKTQAITHTNSIQGQYGDFSNVNDYHDALNSVMAANDRFMALPSSIRARFSNDPAELIKFVSNESNYDEAIQLGLIESSKAQAYLASKNPPIPPSTPAT